MDEAKLKNILENIEVPPVDENARKRAVNMAVSEFKTHQNEKNQKKFQGFSFLSRLMGNSTQNGRDKMDRPTKKRRYKKLLQGTALATLSLAILVPIALDSMTETIISADSTTEAAKLQSANFNMIGDSSSISGAGRVAKMSERKAESRFEVKAPSSLISAPEADVAVAAPPVKRMQMAQGFIFADERPVFVYQEEGRDKFEDFKINPIKLSAEEPVSTFSVDVDTASYSFVRGQLNRGVLPQKDAVRVEELINYFDYNYPVPETKEQPFKPTIAMTDSPWAEGKKLMHIGIKGYDIQGEKPHSNLVFLLDVSGSMNAPDKLPLVKNSMKMLLDNLNPDDTIAIVVYAGAAGTVLEPTKASEKGKIIAALDRLGAGGSTAGAAGVNLAYQLAEQNFDKDSINRVILATDGDFNVGITNPQELQDFVERKRESGIFLSVLGFGQGNYNDHMMQVLAQNGNGIAAYIDSLNEARKVLVDEASSMLFPIAKDVKIQVEFNPAQVAEYRLIGYETRALNREDFNNDKVDAGDIGAGHTVTALYEITPVGSEVSSVDKLRYGSDQYKKEAIMDNVGSEYAFLKIRYKLPDGDTSNLITTPIEDTDLKMTKEMADDVNWAAAVAGFGQILKGGQYTGDFSYDDVIALANGSKGEDSFGTRAEFIQMVRLAKTASSLQPQ